MKTKEIKVDVLEAQQICFALEHEIKSIMRSKENDLEWIFFRTKELQTIYVKFRKIMED